jgi:capsid protein
MNIFSLFATDPAFTSSSVVPFMGSLHSGTRTSTAGMPTDTRKEATPYARKELIKKSRWLYNNMGIVKKFVNGVTKFVTGSGICPMPVTGNFEFDLQCEQYFCNWADYPQLVDTSRKLSFWRMQRNVLRSMFRDGDAFVLKAPHPDEEVIPGTKILGRPRLQWIEAQGVDNDLMHGGVDYDKDGFREGIKHDDYYAPEFYKFLTDSGKNRLDLRGKARIEPASNVLHIFDNERAGQLRGIPWLYHGVNSAVDALDLIALEKHATKIHAAMAAAIKKRSGDAGKTGFSGDLEKKQKEMADGKTRVIAFENFMGGSGILQMALDEEFQLLTSNRPSMTFQGFIDYIIRDMAAGFGTSGEFIWTCMGLGGPNLRFVLEDNKWFFEEIQDLIVLTMLNPIYMWVIARGIERGDLVVPEGVADPYGVAWQGPAKITVDQGKEGNLELERLANGCGTWEEYWNARGKSGRRQVFKRIDEIHEAMKYAKEKNVPFDYVIALKKGGDGDAGKPAGSPGDKPTPDDDED